LWEFRSLFFDVRDSTEPGWGDEILLPWIDDHGPCVAELHEWGRPESHAVRFTRDRNNFSPVETSEDPDSPPNVVTEHWPGAIAGGLLLVRAGVTVRAGANVFDAHVAARSCLYWSWWRRNRIVRDLSHGWGSNSQWGTDFRRDYIVEGELRYNVDRVNQPYRTENRLGAKERLDLLRHRCSPRTDFGAEQWPYDDTYVEPAPRPQGSADTCRPQ
jgi:hypothetical protein